LPLLPNTHSSDLSSLFPFSYQGNGALIIFDRAEADKTYTAALSTIDSLDGVVDKLYTKAKAVTQ
jgi:hypothetical protein